MKYLKKNKDICTRHKISVRSKTATAGITLIALVVTIIVLIILAGISVNMVVNDKGIIKRAEDVKLIADYKNVNVTLNSYKLKKSLATVDGEETTDESLLGTIYKKVFVEDTKRELAVLVDFNEIGIKPTYGQGGKKLVKDDNNDMSTTKTVSTVYELGNIYAIDLADGSLYYINGEQIYTEEGNIVEVAENETTVNKYEVETLNQAYVEARKFKTKWNVTLGEEVGSSTYSTVVLPASTGATYDAIIEWGDGTSTVLQHRVNGITLTADELKKKVTHNYTLAENDDGIREIEISGTYSNFRISNSTTTPTKLKLIELEQWGNVNFTNVNFSGCTNLAGSIPSPNVEDCFATVIDFSSLFNKCASLTGSIPSNLFESATNCTTVAECFRDCSGLEGEIPNLFLNCQNLKNLSRTFCGCTKITSISNEFTIPNSVINMSEAFGSCRNLTSLPDGFTIPNGVTNISGLFIGCGKLISLSKDFNIPDSVTNLNRTFMQCYQLISLPEDLTIPDGVTNMGEMFRVCGNITKLSKNFRIPDGVTNIWGMFEGCNSLTSLPTNFTIPNSVTNMARAFDNCTSLTSLPEDFKISNSAESLQGTFHNCRSLTSLPEGFTIPDNVTDMGATFGGCENLENIPENFTIPDNVTLGYSDYYRGTTPGTFSRCYKLKGTITIRANLTDYTRLFEGTSTKSNSTLTVNYTSNCTNIDDIIATGDSNYIKKGNLVE